MNSQQTAFTTLSIQTPSGSISYVEAGTGPAAMFIHGVVLIKHLWRHQLSGLAGIRRCIAVDLLAHARYLDPVKSRRLCDREREHAERGPRCPSNRSGRLGR
jgi:pimeloyl-ACP methyl ester carboxylesterase